jgi:hypothetical protein
MRSKDGWECSYCADAGLSRVEEGCTWSEVSAWEDGADAVEGKQISGIV